MERMCKNEKVKRMLAMCLACVLLVSAMALPASAASTSGTLYQSATSKTLTLSGMYSSGSGSLTTYSSSNDGVNYYLDASVGGGAWKKCKAHHVQSWRFQEHRNCVSGLQLLAWSNELLVAWWYRMLRVRNTYRQLRISNKMD